MSRREARLSRRALLAVRVALCLQGVWLVAFSAVEFARYDLTYDFAIFFQAGLKIDHGDLSPFSTVENIPFWRDHGGFLMWPLAPLAALPPEGLWLLIAQDVATVAIGWVTVDWIAAMTASKSWPRRLPPALTIAAAGVLWLANPWVYSSAGFDFHLQAFAVLALVLAAKNMWRGRWRRTAVYSAVTLLAGAVAGSYVFGLGVSGMLIARRDRSRMVRSAALACAGLAWTVLLSAIHANLGAPLSAYAYLAGGKPGAGVASIALGVLAHASRLGRHLSSIEGDLILTLRPVGIAGFLSPWGIVPLLTFLVDAANHNSNFALPYIHQPLPMWPLMIVGTVWLAAWLCTRDRGGMLGRLVVAITLACSVTSAVTLLPAYPALWLRTTAASAAAVRKIIASIPPHAEVVVSDGISGRFGSLEDVYDLLDFPSQVPLTRPTVYFVLAPSVGAEDTPANEEAIAVVSHLPHATLVRSSAGVFLFRWTPPPDLEYLYLPAPPR
ncbi:MAG TPA: DUF2079 domain-containing protein [Acidimicrobiales bacterium]|nr:DUF2079 domain-containing protein [Acidimicrobiales bacterium]